MKLERAHEYATVAVAVFLGLLLALYMGASAGTGSSFPLMIIGGMAGVTLALVMRSRIWLLIPMSWALQGNVGFLPGHMGGYMAATLYVFPVFLALKALKIVRTKFHFNWMDYLFIVNILYLVTVYIRHPTGTLAMNWERITVKPYIDVLVSAIGYYVVGHFTIGVVMARRLPLLMFVGDVFTVTLGFITYHFPSTVPIIARFYTGISTQGYDMELATGPDALMQRQEFLGTFGEKLTVLLCSYKSPASLLNPFHFKRFVLFTLGVMGTFLSGYRVEAMGLPILFVLASYFRREGGKCFRLFLVTLPLVVILIGAQGTIVQLPLAMQRSLSFLPGKWNSEATDDATASTEWRTEMWKMVLDKNNHYINEWWLGDGFGYTKRQMEEIQALAYSNDPDQRNTQMGNLLAGSYHNLVLSSIHIVGYIGTTLLTLFGLSLIVYAWKVVVRCRGTPFFACGLFLGLQAIWDVISELFFAGFVNGAYFHWIFWLSMIRLVARSLDKYLEEQREAARRPSTVLPELKLNPFPAAGNL